MSGIARAISPGQVKAKLDNDEDFVLLDVRSMPEWEDEHIRARQVKLIPLDFLREKMVTLPQDREIIIMCRSSVRAYQAQRILNGAGFSNVSFMDGSLAAWPFETSKH
jgi:rhodanese-related sulfurtransferase